MSQKTVKTFANKASINKNDATFDHNILRTYKIFIEQTNAFAEKIAKLFILINAALKLKTHKGCVCRESYNISKLLLRKRNAFSKYETFKDRKKYILKCQNKIFFNV
jgi:hypothetical protein